MDNDAGWWQLSAGHINEHRVFSDLQGPQMTQE